MLQASQDIPRDTPSPGNCQQRQHSNIPSISEPQGCWIKQRSMSGHGPEIQLLKKISLWRGHVLFSLRQGIFE